MVIGPQTKLCISLSGSPGSFGATVHNAAYRALKLDFLYKPCTTNDLPGAMRALRALDIRGCSVSMPFKEAVVKLIDEVDPEAARAGSVNSIVNNAGILSGYSTDIYGARRALEQLGVGGSDSALLLGAGGVARAVLLALIDLGVARIKVANRGTQRLQDLAKHFGPAISAIQWEERHSADVNLVVNATSVGMRDELCAVEMERMSGVERVMDVVVSKQGTALVQAARRAGKRAMGGGCMCIYQAAKQFELYTGHTAPLEIMREAARETGYSAEELGR